MIELEVKKIQTVKQPELKSVPPMAGGAEDDNILQNPPVYKPGRLKGLDQNQLSLLTENQRNRRMGRFKR